MSDKFQRVFRDKPFTALDNAIFRDTRISLKARGLLCTCLSLPSNWAFSIRGLSSICKESRTAIEGALSELEETGYLRRSRLQDHNADGTFGGTEYIFYEVPIETENAENAPCAQNQHTVCSEPPCVQNPHADSPHAGNQPQEINKQEKNKQEKAPKAPKRGRRVKSVPKHEPEMFERFWSAYPRGEDRQGAVREWDKLRPDMDLMRVMSRALKTQAASDAWQRGIGIPYAVRWLRNRRWEDQLAAPPCAIQQADRVESPEVETW